MTSRWTTDCIDGDKRDKKMMKNIYTTVMLFLVMVLLIGGIYLHSVIEVFTA